jgi:hypothetical protein
MQINLKLLHEPFPAFDRGRYLRFSFILGGFVFLFLAFFQPFGITGNTLGLLMICFGFGAITTSLMLLNGLISNYLFSDFLKESTYTIGKEILITLWNFFLIGLGNWCFAAWVFRFPITLNGALIFQLYTLGVGILPICFFILLRYQKLKNLHVDEAGNIQSLMSPIKANSSKAITLVSELKNDNHEVMPQYFVLAVAADNYAEVYFLEDGSLQKRLLRTTISKIAEQFSDYPQVLKCHRAYVVNVQFVISVSGNAQGLQLELQHYQQKVPVSRAMVSELKALLILSKENRV